MEGRWGLWIVGSVDNLPFLSISFPRLIVIYSRFYSVLCTVWEGGWGDERFRFGQRCNGWSCMTMDSDFFPFKVKVVVLW